ncbi:carboxymuconolactone decarboxylase family protein [Agrobacterium tumefaciens]|uniref:carboxymuconolactone decarboxylase family protein n=1 Tax=Agrobacterium tumefaciens TaxID=358 RepID=UPI003BA16549
MSKQIRPRDMAKAFTPALSDFVDDPLFSEVWAREGLSKRDRSLITVAALVVMYRPGELGAHLRRAIENGLSKKELSEVITHLAFYGGFPAAISASSIAKETLGALDIE